MNTDGAACKVVIGLPSSAAELADYRADPRGRDLLATQDMTVQQYERQVLQPLAHAIPIWRNFGARVYAGATLGTLAEALQEGPTASLLLISHWRDSAPPAIEFIDGMVEVTDVAAVVPPAFDGVIDLCVCQSIELAKHLKRRCPQATIKWVNALVTPTIWFHVYSLTLRLMREQQLDYLDALQQSLRRFKNGKK